MELDNLVQSTKGKPQNKLPKSKTLEEDLNI